MLTDIGSENLRARCRARFRPDPVGRGYLFEPDEEFDSGVQCTEAQRDYYVQAFDQVLAGSARFMKFWMIGTTVIAALVYLSLLFFADEQTFDRAIEPAPFIGAMLAVLPMSWLMPKWWRCWQQPVIDLMPSVGAVSRRRSRQEVMDRRYRGMSWMMIGCLGGIGFLGAGMFLPGAIRAADSWTMSALFIVAILVALYSGWRKRCAHRRVDSAASRSRLH